MKEIKTPWAGFESWLTPRIPAGFSARREGRNALLWLLLPGGICLALYGMRFLSAYESLYTRLNGKRVLGEMALMPEFGQLIQWNRWAVILPLLWALFQGINYNLYHRQVTKSIYLMRRLPDRWEFLRRCWTLPLLMAAGTAVMYLLLLGVCAWIYFGVTPKECIPADQWQRLWTVWIGGFLCWN